MSFIVVERDPADGGIRVLLSREFAERTVALDALSGSVAAGDVSVSGEVLIADLSTAVPVLIMPAAVPPGQAAGEPGAPFEAPDDTAVDGGAPAATEDAIFGDIASALRRAATSLESEGVVAPDSISSADDSATAVSGAPGIEAPEDEVGSGAAPVRLEEERPSAAEPVTGTESDTSSAGAGPTGETEPVDEEVREPVGEQWPWANVEAYDTTAAEPENEMDEDAEADPAIAAGPEVAVGPEMPDAFGTPDEVTLSDGIETADEPGPAEGEDASPFVETVAEPASVGLEATAPDGALPMMDPLDEPAVEDSSLIIPAAFDGDDAFLPKPVILGDYESAADDLDAQIASLGAGDAPTIDVVSDDTGLDAQIAALGEPEGPAVEDVTGSGLADAAADPALESETGEPETGPGAPASEVVEYVVGTELDLGEYTCDDCIYVNTCPKVGESTPAECGSFQWKSD